MHLSEKTWINTLNFNDLISAFLFAQDYFKSYKPGNSKEASTAQTIFVAQQLIEINSEAHKRSGDEAHLGENSLKEFHHFLSDRPKIKFLSI